MLRTILVSLWACGVTAGTLYYCLTDSGEIKPADAQEAHIEKEPFFSDPMVVFVPVVSESEVSGYLFANMSVRTDNKRLEGTNIPLNMLIQDSYVTFLTGNEAFALPGFSSFDDQKLKMGVKDQINRIAGKALVDTVYMSDINFLEIKEIRTGTGLKSTRLQEPAVEKPEPEDSKDKSHH